MAPWEETIGFLLFYKTFPYSIIIFILVGSLIGKVVALLTWKAISYYVVELWWRTLVKSHKYKTGARTTWEENSNN